MSDGIGSILIAAFIIALGLLVGTGFVNSLVAIQKERDAQCKQFGPSYSYSSNNYGVDFCVDNNGNGKYLK